MTLPRPDKIRAVAPLMALLSLALALPGCAYLASPDSYWASRMADLADIFVVEVSAGPGVHVHAQATDFLGTGLGLSKQRGIRLYGRYIGTGERLSAGLILMNMSAPVDQEEARMSMYPLMEGSREYRDPVGEASHVYDVYGDGRGTMWCVFPMALAWSGPTLYGQYLQSRWWRVFDVSTGASAFIGFHFCLSPGECVDSLLGWLTIDFAADDL